MSDRRARTRGAAAVVAAVVVAVSATACDESRPVDSQLPTDGTQPVNSMTQDSVMVPGGPDPEPVPAP